MELAFGGVKSNRTPLQTRLCKVLDALPCTLEAFFSSAYLRFMNSLATARAQWFRFLRKLRADGRTNMYGAVPYLMKTFHLDREAAFGIVCEWLDQQEHFEPEQLAPPRRLVRKSG
jgi:hypothetical protein